MDERVFQGMEYVYEVYKAGSFRQAAENLFISQPSISASVRRVEERIGCQIFDRSMKPLRLTQCGEQYIDSVEKILQMERNFVEYVNDWGGLRRGTLVLGGSTFFSSLVLSHLMSRFHRMYPDIQLELVEDSTANLVTLIEDGTVDMVVDYQIPHIENYDWTSMQPDHMLLAVPKHLPENAMMKPWRLDSKRLRGTEDSIASAPVVPLERFRDTAFILLKSGNDSRTRADRLCADAGFEPQVMMEFDQQMTAYHVSCSGMGACFVSSTLVRRFGPDPDMYYYRLGGDASLRQICLLWKHGRYLSKAMAEFRILACKSDAVF